MEDLETHKAPERLQKFFNKLTEFKEFVKNKHEKTKNKDIKEIFDRIDVIFKTKKEEE